MTLVVAVLFLSLLGAFAAWSYYKNTLETLSIIMILDILFQQKSDDKLISDYFPFLKQKKIITKLYILKKFFELTINPLDLTKNNFNKLEIMK